MGQINEQVDVYLQQYIQKGATYSQMFTEGTPVRDRAFVITYKLIALTENRI
jgi:hypothetical protein